MRRLWVSESIPELAAFSVPARRRLWVEASRQTRWGRWGFAAFVVGLAAMLSALYVWEGMTRGVGGDVGEFLRFARIAVAVVTGQVVSRQIGMRTALPHVRRLAAKRCTRCGGPVSEEGACRECPVVAAIGVPGEVGALGYQGAEARRAEERSRGEGAQERAYLLVLLAVVVAVAMGAVLVVRYSVRWRPAAPPPAFGPPAVWTVPAAATTRGGG